MSTDLGVIKGLIELQDDFTSKIGLAEAVLNQFTETNQESMLAVAGAVGIVTAAFGVAAAAVYNLGQRGADVNDVADTLEHFAGTAENAERILQNLRKGTKDTIDDFILMKDASHLLSAGVKLTADDFGVLGSAAFVLQNRGLGGTKEMLDLVSDAMVTGRTRALSMALGVVDAGDAEENYAKTLGITKDQLSDAGKIEAKRIEIMRLLTTAVKDAGAQQRDFGEEVEFAKAQVMNWVDSLGSAIAASPVLKAGINAVEEAFAAAFGDDESKGIDSIMHAIEQGAIVAVDFGLAMVETARVVHVAWSAIEVIVLGVEMAIVGALAGIAHATGHASESLDAMAASLANQVEEAARGVTGHSEFDKTLDKLGGTLFHIKDAMIAASEGTKEQNDSIEIADKNAKLLAKTQIELTEATKQRSIDEEKVAKAEQKSVADAMAVWNEYFALRIKHGGSTQEAQTAQVQRWFDDEVAKLDKSDKNWQKHFDALTALANEKLKDISVDWDYLATHSIKALQDTADKARATYNEMVGHAGNFTRGALEEQRQKVKETAEAARGMGQDFVTAEEAAAEATKKNTAELLKMKKAADDAAAAANRAMGGSQTYDLSTAEGRAKVPPDIAAFLHDGYSFEQATRLAYAMKMGFDASRDPILAHKGPRVPGFAEGGTSDGGMAIVGERGPELVNLPRGAKVTPNHALGGSITNNFYVNGTAADVARKIQIEIMKTLKQGHQFPAA